MADLKDNVKVAIRVRPLNEREVREGGRKCVTTSQNSVSIDARPESKVFTYDYVADEDISQEEFFSVIGSPITDSCLSGYNGTIFAYGQTGAGKTFTIQGWGAEELCGGSSELYEQRGLLPRCFEYIFTEISRHSDLEYLVKCSYLEIYQEQVMDLLDTNGESLQLREDMKRGVYVDGLHEETVTNLMETYELLRIGAQNRHVGSTSMNKESSRSHSVFALVVQSKQETDGLINYRTSKFHLIDLAGSERQRATDAAGERLKEAGMINKSLSALGNVINSLVDISEGKSRHIHYRDSKLTFLLKDSLGGNSKTCIVANISPSATVFGETLSTLKFAARAKQIKNKAIVNEDTSGTLELLREQIRRLKEELQDARAGTCSHANLCVNNSNGANNVKSIRSLDNLDSAFNPQTENTQGELERLLSQNLRQRQETEKFLGKELEEKDRLIEAYKQSLAQLEKKISNDKMVLKFRDATIARLQTGRSSDGALQELQTENSMLREQVENNPQAAKLFVENNRLSQELEKLKTLAQSTPGSLSWRLQEAEDFSRKVVEELSKKPRNSTDDDAVIKIKLEYGEKISELSDELAQERELRKEIEASIQSSQGQKAIEAPAELSQEVEKLQTQLALKEEDLAKALHDLKREVESSEILSQELRFQKQKAEEKESELRNAQLETENLSEASEFLKAQNRALELASDERALALETVETAKGKLVQELEEAHALVRSLQAPEGNSPLALALAESEALKGKLTEKQEQLQERTQELQMMSENLACSQQEASEFNKHYLAAKQVVVDQQQKLQIFKERLEESKENELYLTEKFESYKEENKNLSIAKAEIEESLSSKENRISELTSEIRHLEKELNTKHKQGVALEEAQSSLEHYKAQTEMLAVQLNEMSSELCRSKENVLQQSLLKELETAKEEINSLKEENAAKMEILKNTNKNILSTRNEINMWKKCIDEKNQAIQDLRGENRKKDEELYAVHSKLKSAGLDSVEIEHLRQVIEIKDKELRELKTQGKEYYSQADHTIESLRRELQISNKRCSSLVSDVKRLKEELHSCLRDREGMLEEIEKLRDEEFRNFQDSDDFNKLKEDKTHLIRELELLRDENDKLLAKSKAAERLKLENNNLKNHNYQLVDELKLKTIQMNKLQQQMTEFIKQDKSHEEVENLSSGIAKIADYVFSLPCVSFNPEETGIVESTIKAIESVYELVLIKDEELARLKTNRNKRNTEPDRGKPTNFRNPIEYYHALLQASSIKPGEILSPSGDKHKHTYH